MAPCSREQPVGRCKFRVDGGNRFSGRQRSVCSDAVAAFQLLQQQEHFKFLRQRRLSVATSRWFLLVAHRPDTVLDAKPSYSHGKVKIDRTF